MAARSPSSALTASAFAVPRPARAVASSWAGVLAVIAWALVEYGRPQDVFPALEAARVAIVAAIPLALLLFVYRYAVPWGDPVFRPMLLLLLFMGAWLPFAPSFFFAFNMFKTFLMFILFMLAFATFVNTLPRLRLFLFSWIGVVCFQAAWGMLHRGRGVGAHFYDENDFSLGLAVALPFAVFGIFATPRRILRLPLLAAALLYVAAIVVSDSRGGLVGLAATAGMMLLLSQKRKAALVIGAVSAAALLVVAPAAYWVEMRTMFDQQDVTRMDRIRLWSEGVDAWQDNPVFGVGPNNFRIAIEKYAVRGSPLEGTHEERVAHSVYVTVLTEFGVVGVVLYTWLALVVLRDCRAVMRARAAGEAADLDFYARAVLCGATAYLSAGIFITVLDYPHPYYLAAIAASVRGMRERTLPAPALRSPS